VKRQAEDRLHRVGRVIEGDTETAIVLSVEDAKRLDAEATSAQAIVRSSVPMAADLTMDRKCRDCGAEGLSWYRSQDGRPYLAGLYIVDYDARGVYSRYEIRPHFLVCSKGAK
jgi:hypothetical protein